MSHKIEFADEVLASTDKMESAIERIDEKTIDELEGKAMLETMIAAIERQTDY